MLLDGLDIVELWAVMGSVLGPALRHMLSTSLSWLAAMLLLSLGALTSFRSNETYSCFSAMCRQLVIQWTFSGWLGLYCEGEL